MRAEEVVQACSLPLNVQGKTPNGSIHIYLVVQEAEKRGKKLFLYTGPQPQARANAAVLVSGGVLPRLQQHGGKCYRPPRMM